MKSQIKIDIVRDKPVLTIKSVHTSNDLRDKCVSSFLQKLGFTYAKHDQVAALQINYIGWGSQGDDSYEEFIIFPIDFSVKSLNEGITVETVLK